MRLAGECTHVTPHTELTFLKCYVVQQSHLIAGVNPDEASKDEEGDKEEASSGEDATSIDEEPSKGANTDAEADGEEEAAEVPDKEGAADDDEKDPEPHEEL